MRQKNINRKNRLRLKRKISIRKRVKGTAERPRMTIYKSNKYVYIQVIDDIKGHTLVSVSNLEKALRDVKNTIDKVGQLGELAGKRLKENKISKIVFDRNGYKYHGIIKTIAEATRKAGINF